MRVLMVNHTSVISGAERSLLDLLENLSPEFDATVACPRGELADRLAAGGRPWIEIPPFEASLKLDLRFTTQGLVSALRAARRLRAHAKGFDVVHANSIRAGVVCTLARLTRPLVLHVRDCLPPTNVTRLVTRSLARSADALAANSEFTGECFRKTAQLRKLDVTVVPGPLDLTRFLDGADGRMAAREALGLEPDAPLLGVVGQITPWKGQHTAIEVLARVRETYPAAHLVIVGSPRFTGGATRYDNLAYEGRLRKMVGELGLTEAVSFLGEREDVPRLMGCLDLLLVPSTEEPFGRVVVEGMAAGRAVVATDQGGPAEIVDNESTGFVAPPTDSQAWADTVTALIADPERREDVGRRARDDVATRYIASASVGKLTTLWRSLARERPLRILFVSHTGAQSGAEHAMLRLLEALPDDHPRAVACPPGGKLKASVEAHGMTQYDLPGTDISLRLRPLPTLVGLARGVESAVRLRRIAQRFGADVVHANSPRAGLIACGTRRLGGPPVVVQCHDHLPTRGAGNLARRAIAREAQDIVAVTNYTAERFNHGLKTPRARCVHISIDHERFMPQRDSSDGVRAELGIGGEVRLLAEVAQITPWKGQDTAIRALRDIREHIDAHLLIVGAVAFESHHYDNVGYGRSLLELVEGLDLGPFVHFLGQRNDVPRLMGATDLLLLPSWDEPFGTVVAEAMAVGTPVLVTNKGGLDDYVTEGVNGRLLPPHEPALWADVALELLEDPETLARISRQNVLTAAQFTDENYSAAMLSAYRRAIGGL